MSTNIHLEAELSPAIHSLRRISQPSPSKKEKKGSFEMYKPEQKSFLPPEKIGMTSIALTAPGSPSSMQDYKQVVQKLQQDLEQSKRKELELEQMLLGLKNPLGTMFMDKSYITESPSEDNLGENVKDAHIRHLQRQVTVLQASLYKSEGWTHRVASAIKERDKALEDVGILTSRIREMQEVNSQLLNRIDSLSSVLQTTYANLQQTTEELQSHHFSGRLVSQLKDEIHRQGFEIKTLKESHNRLDMENRGLRGSSVEANTHAVTNLTCSQELEHLHNVVDRLKNTVLQQRSYLLQLRQSSSGSGVKSLSPSPALAFIESAWNQESMQLKHPTQSQNSSDALPNSLATGRVSKTNEKSKETFKMDSSPLRNGNVGLESRQQMANKLGYTYQISSQNQQGQQSNADIAKQNSKSIGMKPISGRDSLKPLQHSRNGPGVFSPSAFSSRLEPSDRQMMRSYNTKSANNSAALPTEKVKISEEDNDFGTHLRSPSNGGQIYTPLMYSQQETKDCEENTFPVESLEQLLCNGSFQLKQSQFSNLQNQKIAKGKQIYHPPSNYHINSSNFINDIMAGGKLAVSTSPAHSSILQAAGNSKPVVFVNSSGDQATSTASNSADGNLGKCRQDSDRLCPVCNNDFSYMNLEEFQTHIFECFDDNSPVTMKPVEPSDRLCPMCNARFGPTIDQAEFEKHVHNHFGDEAPGSNFVILQP